MAILVAVDRESLIRINHCTGSALLLVSGKLPINVRQIDGFLWSLCCEFAAGAARLSSTAFWDTARRGFDSFITGLLVPAETQLAAVGLACRMLSSACATFNTSVEFAFSAAPANISITR